MPLFLGNRYQFISIFYLSFCHSYSLAFVIYAYWTNLRFIGLHLVIRGADKEKTSIFSFCCNCNTMQVKCPNNITVTYWSDLICLISQDIVFCHEHVHLLMCKTIQKLWDIFVIIHHCKNIIRQCCQHKKIINKQYSKLSLSICSH
jgi:hypothetical protein